MVTTTTAVATTATVDTGTAREQSFALGAVTLITLLALLLIKELAIGARTTNAALLGRATNLGIIPLGLAFLLIVAVKLFT